MDFENLNIQNSENVLCPLRVVPVSTNISTVRLICEADVNSIPFWLINDVAYYWKNVPPYHSYDVNSKALVIALANFYYNNSRYQCHFSTELKSNSVVLRMTNIGTYIIIRHMHAQISVLIYM